MSTAVPCLSVPMERQAQSKLDAAIIAQEHTFSNNDTFRVTGVATKHMWKGRTFKEKLHKRQLQFEQIERHGEQHPKQN